MFEKVWDAHVIHEAPGEPALLYVDLHLVHEVTSPQAFDGLRMAGRPVRRPDLTIATADHNVPTAGRNLPIRDEIARKQLEALTRNCEEFGITLYDMDSPLAGHRAYHRPGAGPDAPRHGRRVRRQPHVHARRVRRLRDGHRHVGGRARARHADAEAPETQDDADRREGQPSVRRHAQGPRPRHHRPDRNRRRRRSRDRVRGRGCAVADDGRPHDRVQHVDRGWSASRHGGAGRHHVRVPQEPRPCPERR